MKALLVGTDAMTLIVVLTRVRQWLLMRVHTPTDSDQIQHFGMVVVEALVSETPLVFVEEVVGQIASDAAAVQQPLADVKFRASFAIIASVSLEQGADLRQLRRLSFSASHLHNSNISLFTAEYNYYDNVDSTAQHIRVSKN